VAGNITEDTFSNNRIETEAVSRPKNSTTRITSRHISRTSVDITHPDIYNTVNYTVKAVINFTIPNT